MQDNPRYTRLKHNYGFARFTDLHPGQKWKFRCWHCCCPPALLGLLQAGWDDCIRIITGSGRTFPPSGNGGDDDCDGYVASQPRRWRLVATADLCRRCDR